VKRKTINEYIKTTRVNKRRSGEEVALERFVLDMHAEGKCGRAAAEYNLVKAGAIEVTSGHVPGHLREDNVFFEPFEWKLTELRKMHQRGGIDENHSARSAP
jgi:hypothetical protein